MNKTGLKIAYIKFHSKLPRAKELMLYSLQIIIPILYSQPFYSGLYVLNVLYD